MSWRPNTGEKTFENIYENGEPYPFLAELQESVLPGVWLSQLLDPGVDCLPVDVGLSACCRGCWSTRGTTRRRRLCLLWWRRGCGVVPSVAAGGSVGGGASHPVLEGSHLEKLLKTVSE